MTEELALNKDRPAGHYWVRFGRSPHWDVMYWHAGYFWGTAGDGYQPQDMEIGPRVYPPDSPPAGEIPAART